MRVIKNYYSWHKTSLVCDWFGRSLPSLHRPSVWIRSVHSKVARTRWEWRYMQRRADFPTLWNPFCQNFRCTILIGHLVLLIHLRQAPKCPMWKISLVFAFLIYIQYILRKRIYFLQSIPCTLDLWQVPKGEWIRAQEEERWGVPSKCTLALCPLRRHPRLRYPDINLGYTLLGPEITLERGCENVAGKLRQRW